MMKNISFLFAIYADGKLTIINCQGIIFTTKIQALERSEKQMRYKNGENEL